MTIKNFQKNVLLANCTTFKIGGRAKYFFIAKNSGQIIEAIKTARKFKIPYFILGGGSNILISDIGFDGLVIKTGNSKKIEKRGETLVAEAGTELKNLHIVFDQRECEINYIRFILQNELIFLCSESS